MSGFTVLTQILPKPRLLESSERRGHVGLVVGVDEDCSSFQPLANVHGFVDVSCEDSRRQAKLGVVSSAQYSVYVAGEKTFQEPACTRFLISWSTTYPSLNLDTTMTGPNDSSLAMNMWSSTSVKTVGSMKNPAQKCIYTERTFLSIYVLFYIQENKDAFTWTSAFICFMVMVRVALHNPAQGQMKITSKPIDQLLKQQPGFGEKRLKKK